MSYGYSKKFYNWNPPASMDKELFRLKSLAPEYWEKLGHKKVLDLFHFTAHTVPAYKTVLKESGIRPVDIKTINKYGTLPTLDKINYLRKYPYKNLFPHRDLSRISTISATSGSTGPSFYIPRGMAGDAQYRYFSEVFFKNQFAIDERVRTLVVVGFGMGLWIAGTSTYSYLSAMAKDGYPISIIPVGSNVSLCLEAIKSCAHFFDRIILMGYPPMIKDVVDSAKSFGIDWKNYDLKLVFSGEGFSERFRSSIAKKARIRNALTDIVGLYGSTELGGMGHETPLSTLIRVVAGKNKKVFNVLFPDLKSMPTLTQFYPHITYFEEQDGELLATGHASSIPLLRYRFPDRGGVIQFKEMVEKLRSVGVDIFKASNDAGITKYILHLPFVYVGERSDGAVILCGVNIYPQVIKDALYSQGVSRYVTGRFYLIKKEDKKAHEWLEIHIEKKRAVKINNSLIEKINDAIIKAMRKHSSEFNHLYAISSTKITPRITLWPYHDSLYFESGKKHKWVPKFQNL